MNKVFSLRVCSKISFIPLKKDLKLNVQVQVKTLPLYMGIGTWKNTLILVQVSAIETCFMSIDEIARIFSSPRAYGEARNFFQVPRTFFRKAIFRMWRHQGERVAKYELGEGVGENKDMKHVKSMPELPPRLWDLEKFRALPLYRLWIRPWRKVAHEPYALNT